MLDLIAVSVLADATFDDPVEVLAGDEKIKLIYPTPVLQDLDGDGTRELVLGDLRGQLLSCEAGDTDTNWKAKVTFETNGKPLKLNNW